jgi:hypothetical protein
MATKQKQPTKTNFDVWRETLTPEFIADSKFITLACGACPARGVACDKYDTACRGNFLLWAKSAYQPKGVDGECGS